MSENLLLNISHFMEDKITKKTAFEYLVFLLIQWHKEVAPYTPINSLTRVKILKLLFFVATIKTSEENNDLLDIFDKFYAMPYGPVESDIYNYMSSDSLQYFSFKDCDLECKEIYRLPERKFSTELQRIKCSVDTLRTTNNQLIKYEAFELVEITHKWAVWRNSIDTAHAVGRNSILMPISEIRMNRQIFR